MSPEEGSGGPPPRLSTVQAIRPLEGRRIVVAGRLVPPGGGKDLHKLRLEDGKRIVIGHFAAEAETTSRDLEALAGRDVAVSGRVYFRDIPEAYSIYARIGDPYLVDITRIAEEQAR